MRSDHIIVYEHGIVQYILSVQVFICYKNWILHRQTIYKITGKVMPFYNTVTVLKYKLNHSEKIFTFFTFHAPFHPPNLFSTWNKVSENIVNALNVVNFAHHWPGVKGK
jgi:hypothetical protein